MKISITDYNGFNPNCEKTKKTLAFIQKKGFVSLKSIFNLLNFDYNRSQEIMRYLKEDRKDEFIKEVEKIFKFEVILDQKINAISKLESSIFDLETQIKNITPAKAYKYFRTSQKNLTDRSFDSIIDNVLFAILSNAIFKDGEYKELRKELSGHGYHCDIERHYAIAITSKNNTLYHQIEQEKGRKPYIVDGQRCYEGLSFYLGNNEHYKCTGWVYKHSTEIEQPSIKFVKSSDRDHKENRKLISMTYPEFKEYFRNKKIIY